jgi:hypothetical protein
MRTSRNGIVRELRTDQETMRNSFADDPGKCGAGIAAAVRVATLVEKRWQNIQKRILRCKKGTL